MVEWYCRILVSIDGQLLQRNAGQIGSFSSINT